MTKVDFATLGKIDVTAHIEKKGQFSYLSWPYAVSEFRKAGPDGYWRITGADNGIPYGVDASGAYVGVTVFTAPDCPGFTQVHPVLNHKNKPILEPTSFDINTSIQRCLVKAIALATGIGLHLYAGEDLPPVDVAPIDPAKKADTMDKPGKVASDQDNKTQQQTPTAHTKKADFMMQAVKNVKNETELDEILNHENFRADYKILSEGFQKMILPCINTRKNQLKEAKA